MVACAKVMVACAKVSLMVLTIRYMRKLDIIHVLGLRIVSDGDRANGLKMPWRTLLTKKHFVDIDSLTTSFKASTSHFLYHHHTLCVVPVHVLYLVFSYIWLSAPLDSPLRMQPSTASAERFGSPYTANYGESFTFYFSWLISESYPRTRNYRSWNLLCIGYLHSWDLWRWWTFAEGVQYWRWGIQCTRTPPSWHCPYPGEVS